MNSKVCILFFLILGHSVALQNCNPGECPNFSCGLQGLCLVMMQRYFYDFSNLLNLQGDIVNTFENSNAFECGNFCFSDPECYWYSHNPNESQCILFKNCPTLDTDQTDFISSQKECWHPESSCEFYSKQN